MKKFIYLLLVLLTFTTGQLFASHVAGGQITYKFISTSGTNHTYEVEIVLFGDCAGIISSTLDPSTGAGLRIYNSGTQTLATYLPKIPAESGVLISPVCPTAINNTTCSSGGTIVGIKKYTYRGNVVINGTSANWRFVSDGTIIPSATTNIRSVLADNVVNPSATTMYLEATLNNLNGQNSTPIFTSDPTPFYCVNIASSFGLGAVESDGDAMSYSLEPAMTNLAGTTFLAYQPGYSAVNPLNVTAGSFTYSTTSGVADFIPAASPWEGIVVNKVHEMRGGVVVGTAMREMMFVFISNCTNTAPSTPVANVNNGELLPGGTSNNVEFRVCEAQQVNFNFEISPVDPQGDNITITSTNIPAGATFNVTNNNTPSPTASFDWDLSIVPAGTYQFYITFKDDGCPLSSVKTVSYTVHVQEFSGNFTTGYQQNCREMANGFAWIKPSPTDTAKYIYTWTDPAFNVLQTTSTLQNHADTLFNLTPGVYLVEAENYRGCKRRFTIMIDSPTYKAYFEADSIICVNRTVTFNPLYNNSDFTSWSWDFGNGTTSTDQEPTVQYPVAGEYTIKLKATTDIGCVDSFEQRIVVDSIMRPEFDLARYDICVGSKVDIAAQYGINATKVQWTFGDGGTLATSPVTVLDYAYPNPGTYNINMKVSYRTCPDVIFTRSVTVNEHPKVFLGYDTALCYQGTPIELKNVHAGITGDRYSWNTGETTPSMYAKHHGVYALTVTRSDCSTTDSVTINKDCYIDIPNAFVPGSGDQTGYFLPRSILSKGVTKFDMTVFNRWGEQVFFTANTNGRGWDGNLNGQAQPAGVYVYQINVTYQNGKSDKYQGNVTLMR